MKLASLIILGLAFCAGVAWRTTVDVSSATVVLLLVVSIGLALTWRRSPGSLTSGYILLASLALVFCVIGVVRAEVATWKFIDSNLGEQLDSKVEIFGVISKEPNYRASTVQLYVDTGSDIILVSTDRQFKVEYGDEVLVSGQLKQPEKFTTELGREFDYPGYLKVKGVQYLVSFAGVEVVGSDKGNLVIGMLLKGKQLFLSSLEQIIPEPEIGLGKGLLLGVKSALGDDIEEDFRRTGIIHIVVLSGYNVMLVVAFIMLVLSFFLPMKLRIVVGILSIIAFALVVGGSATVVRASVMASLVLLAQVWGRRYDVLRALIFAGIVMLLINPYLLIYDIGFQLSFMATLGLVLLTPHFESMIIQSSSHFGWRDFFFATLATQIAVAPLLMYHIGEISLVAVLVNVLILPVVPLAMLLTFTAGLVGLVSTTLANLVGLFSFYSLSYILFIADFFAQLPLASVSVPAFSGGLVLVMYVGLFWLYIFLQRRLKSDSDMPGWVIEDENQKDDESDNSSSSSEVPILFR